MNLYIFEKSIKLYIESFREISQFYRIIKPIHMGAGARLLGYLTDPSLSYVNLGKLLVL